MVSSEFTASHDGALQEDIRWIGKPWRRLELLNHRYYYRGECIETTWTASASLGLRRLGWHLHFALTRDRDQNYSEEPP
jgi:hypothetical protein